MVGSVLILFILTIGGVMIWRWRVNHQSPSGQSASQKASPRAHVASSTPSAKPDPATTAAASVPSAPTPASAAATPQPAPANPLLQGKRLGYFTSQKSGNGEPDAARQAAVEALQARVPQVAVQFDPITGAPSSITSVGRFLTPAVAPGGDPLAQLRQFVNDNSALFSHDASALAASRVTRDDVTAHSGMHTVVWQQQVDGIPLYNTIFKANLTGTGAVVAVGSQFMADPTAGTQMDATQRAALIAQPPVDAGNAVSLAAANIGEQVAAEQVAAASSPTGAERRQNLAAPNLSDVVTLLSWLPMDANKVRLAWDVTLMSTKQKAMYQMLVDVQTGEVLLRRSLTADISNASYRVYADGTSLQPFDSPSPMSPGLPAPGSTQPTAVSRNVITTQAFDTTASPNGWIDDSGTATYGNNVDAHLDTGNTNPAYGAGTHAVSLTRNFDFTLDLTQDPTTYQNAVLTELFYACNYYHDKLYELGFTESAGNFQQNNFGRGGAGNDAVLADAQDGSGTNNANFSTPADGSPGRMQMYIFTGPSPHRDGDLDMQVVFHEHTHGVSNRLVGGGVGISQLQTQGMGEGWSDFYALCLLSKPADDVNGTYPAGAYVTYQLSGLTSNYYYGIRRYPYTTDMTRNPLTLKDIDPTHASAHATVPCSPIFSPPNVNSSEVHNQGEVWCVTLWDVRANLVNKLGAVAGNQMVLQLVTDGMKLSPANPTFLQARDAIIQADLVDNGGANKNELWNAFAKRGMGASATVPASNTTTGVIEAYDLPDSLNVSPASTYLALGQAGGPFTPPAQVYTLTNNGTSPISWSAANAQPWLTLSATGGTLANGASAQVIATLNSAATNLANGSYSDSITFSDITTSLSQNRSVSLRVGQKDYFTEQFTSGNDTDNQSWLFTPNASNNFYSVRRTPTTAFPTDPTGGTNLPLSDDSYALVTLTGAQVSLYGTTYSSFYVGSNGYITFNSGDSTYSESLSAHFNRPRISALFRDLNPGTGGTVSWKQLSDHVAVTWQNVPEFGTSNSNSFQIELYFDGRLRITCLNIAASTGLIGLSQGLGIPADYLASDFDTYTSVQFQLAIPSTTIEGAGVLAGQGMVNFSAAQATATTVSLVSSNTSKVTVPASVTIPAGQTSATFDLTVIDNAILDGTQTSVISATTAGGYADTKVIAVQDNETAVLSVGAPSVVSEGAGTVQGTVSINSAPAADISVTLSSSDTSALTPPATVTIPAGQTSANFPITIIDDHKINGTHNATVTAHVANWTDGAATVAIQDNESVALTLSIPASMSEGQTVSGTVSISGTLTTPLTVSFSSNNTNRLASPAQVTIPAGSTSATLSLNAPDNSVLDGTANVTITATASGFTNGIRTIQVLDNEVDHFVFATIGSPQPLSTPFGVTVTALDVNNAVVAGFTGTVTFSATAGVTVSPGTSTNFVGGQWTGNVSVTGAAGTTSLIATNSAGATGQSNTFTTTVPVVSSVSLASNDLVYDPGTSRIYVSVPSTDTSGRANTITPLDPVTQAFGTPIPVGTNPSKLAVSDDNQFLFVGLRGASTVSRIALASQSINLQINLGSASGSSLYAEDIQVVPGNPHAIVVSRDTGSSNYGVAIFDDAVQRTTTVDGYYIASSIAFGSSPNTVYGANGDDSGFEFRRFTISSSGIVQQDSLSDAFQQYGTKLRASGNLLFGSDGTVIDPVNRNLVARLPVYGPVQADVPNGRAYYLANGSDSTHLVLHVFNTTTFAEIGSLTISGVSGTPGSLIRWPGGLAFRTSGNQIFIINTALATVPANTADLVVTQIASPSPAVAGQPLTFSYCVTNAGPAAAANASLSSTLPGGVSVVSTTSTQGTVSTNQGVVTANLGTLAAGATATVAVTVLPSAAGSLTSTASVTSSTADPITTNNTTSQAVTVNPPSNSGPQISVIALPVSDLAYDAIGGQLYAATSSSGGLLANAVAAIDPTFGGVTSLWAVGSNPDRVVCSDDGQFLYVGLRSASSISRLNLASKTVDLQMNLGTDQYDGFLSTEDLAVLPGQGHSLAVSRYGYSNYNDGVVIFDDAVQRPASVSSSATDIVFGSSANTLYGYNGEDTGFNFFRFNLSPNGISLLDSTSNLLGGFSTGIAADGGFVYGSNGAVVNPQTKMLVTTLPASGLVCPEVVRNRVYFLTQNGSTATLKAFDATTYAQVATSTVSGLSGSAARLIRCGGQRLAFCTSGGQVFIVRDATLVPSILKLSVPAVTVEGAGQLLPAGTVSVSEPQSSDITVNLTSSNTSKITVPQSVVIPAGQLSTAFALTVLDNTILDGPQKVVISAAATGLATTTASIQVNDNETASFSVTLPSSALQGGTFRGIVTISAPPANDIVVSLSSNSPWLQVPATVTILAGQTYGVFTATVLDAGQVIGSQSVSVTAHVDNWTDGTSTFNIVDGVNPANWPNFGNGAGHTGYQPVMLGTASFGAGWSTTSTASSNVFGLNQVAVSGGVVYVTPYTYSSDSYVSALDAVTGTEIWRHTFAVPAFSVNPPTVYGGKIYVQRGDSYNDSQLWCFDAATGSPNWDAPFSAQWERYFAPLVINGGVWVDGGGGGGLYGFNTSDGTQRFFNSSIGQYDQWTPAYYNGVVYTWVAGNFRAHDPQMGSILWSLNLGGTWNTTSMNTAPVVYQGRAFVVGSPNLYAVDLTTHVSPWNVAGTFKGTPAVANGVVYALSADKVYAYTRKLGHYSAPMLPATRILPATDRHE
ncbi:M36 family metallopeptidase [Chthoniobacter flavus]|uniref:M36 family metallopeptidase n=1 Tax=Chthoniobacter flavus TaxID=191863 RepID=UPI000318AC46|nr:M36 family metallopeptidase [Chthoniobacter flavus]